MCVPITPSNTKATQYDDTCLGYCTSPASWAAIVRKLCREWKSEAYPCREKLGEISRRFSDFWLLNALLTANLCGNPANLCDNRAFLGDARPQNDIGMVLYGPFVKACGALPEVARGLFQAKRQTFHGKVANLSDKSQLVPRWDCR